MIIRPASDHSLLVSFGNEISPEIHRSVLRLCALLDGRPEIRNLHPGYSSVLITFDPLRTAHAELEHLARAQVDQLDSVALPESRVVEIPVNYGGEFGPDLEDVARLNRLTPEEVARIHSSAEYTVYFLGFSPGFPYLGGLPSAIATARLDTPRKQVPAGSVAIGGTQTGIYPVASPGGWRIIGRTTLPLFTPERQPITLLQMGDHVRFVGL